MKGYSNMTFITLPIKRGFTEIRDLYELITPLGGVICGGYARYVCSPSTHPILSDDVDVYCKTMEAFDTITAILESESFVKSFESDMSISYKRNKIEKWLAMPEVNLIKPMIQYRIVSVGTAEEIIGNFDFSVARAAIISPTECLVDEDFERDEKTKKIRIKNIHCPVSSARRCMKYTKKGYYVSLMEIVKLFLDWENRSEEYRMNLRTLVEKAATYNKENIENPGGLTEEERALLYKLFSID
jgi:hypothetical protein